MSARAQTASWEYSGASAPSPAHPAPVAGWISSDEGLQAFADEQVRGLVWRIFLGPAQPVTKHVLVSTMDQKTDSSDLCEQMGLTLARETVGTVLVVKAADRSPAAGNAPSSVREASQRLATNFWMMEGSCSGTLRLDRDTANHREAFLQQVRREFDYSILQVTWSRLLSEAIRMGQASDGLILVLGAHGTRKAAAQQIHRTLTTAGVRLIGTVLSGRTFPVPESLYRIL